MKTMVFGALGAGLVTLAVACASSPPPDSQAANQTAQPGSGSGSSGTNTAKTNKAVKCAPGYTYHAGRCLKYISPPQDVDAGFTRSGADICPCDGQNLYCDDPTNECACSCNGEYMNCADECVDDSNLAVNDNQSCLCSDGEMDCTYCSNGTGCPANGCSNYTQSCNCSDGEYDCTYCSGGTGCPANGCLSNSNLTVGVTEVPSSSCSNANYACDDGNGQYCPDNNGNC